MTNLFYVSSKDGGARYSRRRSSIVRLSSELNDPAPRRKSFAAHYLRPFRYGETRINGGFYTDGSSRPGVATAVLHQGKELSYNNINDTDAAFELASEFDPANGPVCAIIKHANPCGVARGDSVKSAYTSAFDCDRTSAFGGIVALNTELDADTAALITDICTEVVIALSHAGRDCTFCQKAQFTPFDDGKNGESRSAVNQHSTGFRRVSFAGQRCDNT